ncbi:MAG: ABC transporter permease [Deinococcota bacterium]|nr:ABC transporter permease [Deinococcota bacterium]
MLAFIVRRLAALLLLMIGISLITFLMVRMVPGDPAALYYGGAPVSEEVLQALRRQWGLDRPLPVQYLYYLGGLARGNLGVSLTSGRPVLDDLIRRFPATVELTVAGVVLAIMAGFPLGVVAALHRNRLSDHALRIVSLVSLGMPNFWLGLVLIYLFGYLWPVFPPAEGRLASGIIPPERFTGLYIFDSLLQGNWAALRSAFLQLLAPAITVALGLIAVIIRMLRAGMLEELGKDYIRTARAKGLSARLIFYKHALRNAVLPTLTVISIQIGYLLGGNVLVEAVFDWPGIGLYYINAVNNLDYNAVVGTTLLIAVVFTLINLFVDILNALVDPRIQYG